MSPVRLVFWTSALALAYLTIGYPLLMWCRARLRPWPFRGGAIRPQVTVVVVAQDEGAAIERRVENLLRLAYPRDRLDILIASDGSSDDTVEKARRNEGVGLRVIAFPRRRGKAAVLNDVVPRARGEIVVLGDARQVFDPRALLALVAPFADPRVGAVGGRLTLDDERAPGAGPAGAGTYWRYETALRRNESLVDSTIGVSGAIYAIRRDLYERIPEDTLLDDVLIPMRITRRGYRVVLQPDALAHDRPPASAAQEFARKTRTLAGNFQLFSRERWLFDPRRNRLWLQTVSHKALRLAGPAFLVGLLAASLFLWRSPVYGPVLLVQLAFYAAALVGGLVSRRSRGQVFLGAPYAFCLLNAAILVGFVRFATGRQSAVWKRPAPGGAAAWPVRDRARR